MALLRESHEDEDVTSQRLRKTELWMLLCFPTQKHQPLRAVDSEDDTAFHLNGSFPFRLFVSSFLTSFSLEVTRSCLPKKRKIPGILWFEVFWKNRLLFL